MITLDNVKTVDVPDNWTQEQIENFKKELATDKNYIEERVFYVFDVHDQKDRGEHSHHKTEQVLICLSGKVKVLCDDGKNTKQWVLNKPTQALYIPNLIWDEQIYLTSDSVLLVLANTNYDSSDYIESYDEFKRLKNESK